MTVELDPDIVLTFAKQPLQALFVVPRVLSNSNHPAHDLTLNELKKIDSKAIDLALADKDFQFLNRDSDDLEYKAREWILIKSLEKEIEKLRTEKLKNQHKSKIPAPYTHSALNGVTLRRDFLVSVQQFEVRQADQALIRDGIAFTLSPSIRQLNSSHWLMNALLTSSLQEIFVRLDPLIYDKCDKIMFPSYKMQVYGRPFQWNEILDSKEEVHGRWMPDVNYKHSEMTEFVWAPKGDEIHFTCEEIPKKREINRRGSRYFHTIYSKKKTCFIHLDGAIRFFNDLEWSKRKETHIRKSGKLGKRIKLFLVDEELSLETMANLCASFFVWNEDVINYFN